VVIRLLCGIRKTGSFLEPQNHGKMDRQLGTRRRKEPTGRKGDWAKKP